MNATVDKFEEEFSVARVNAMECCGVKPEVRYDPGCTFVECPKCGDKVANPDWTLKQTVSMWNARRIRKS